MQCVSRGQYVWAGQHHKCLAQQKQLPNSSTGALPTAAHTQRQCSPPPRQLQLPGKELARKKEAHKELGITNCSPQYKRKVLAHHREAHGIALAIIHNQSNIKNKIKAKPGKSWLRTTSLFQNTAHKNPGSLIKLCLGGRKHSSTKPAVCFVNRQKRTGV